jgi:hypothetical protein
MKYAQTGKEGLELFLRENASTHVCPLLFRSQLYKQLVAGAFF